MFLCTFSFCAEGGCDTVNIQCFFRVPRGLLLRLGKRTVFPLDLYPSPLCFFKISDIILPVFLQMEFLLMELCNSFSFLSHLNLVGF